MNNLHIDQTIGYVKKLVENIQCAICDKTDGQQMRYACGHSACEHCIIDAVDCQICHTPSPVSSEEPKLDNALTQRVKNATELLKVCEDLFNTYVFKHKRLSEQLRIEKELFPECIQAPAKYENKRKSTFVSYNNKENSNTKFFPGEDTSPRETFTMENSARYVQQWLSKNDTDFARKPFRDLNVNNQMNHKTILPKNNYILQTKNDENISVLKTNRKRSHFKTTVKSLPAQTGNIKSIKKQHPSSKKVKKELDVPTACLVRNKTKNVCDNNESGIFMDDEPIVIDDSQETIIDKDRNAWLAVLEANENEIEPTSLVNIEIKDHKTLINTNKETPLQSDYLKSKTEPNIKVPFYKKSYIIETCTYCNVGADKAVAQPEKVEITIDNANFTTTIKIVKDVENKSKLMTKKTVSVQTNFETIPIDDIRFTNLSEEVANEDVVSLKSDTQSEDLFEEEEQNIRTECIHNKPYDCFVIAESDSDMEVDISGPLPVKVDVHRSCDESEYGVLSEIVNTEAHNARPRRGPRGLTPTSTDSSDKENYNPNRMKRYTPKKKKNTKK